LHQPIYDIAEICARKGIDSVVICPGSRSAPLVLGFARHEKVSKHVVVDERCAAYMALGMAQTSGKPVALVCTSGTAVLNFAPALAEAFYLGVPLLVLTADRPPEWLDQADGQTIRQQNVFGTHVKKSYQLPADYTHQDSVWFVNRVINEAINLSQSPVQGPVHVNVPLREPLYPSHDAPIEYSNVRIFRRTQIYSKVHPNDWEVLKAEFNLADKKLLVLGQMAYSPEVIKELRAFVEDYNIPLVADVTSNAHFIRGDIVRHQDLFLANLTEKQLESLKPELLITMGSSVVSKHLKIYLRKYKPESHWHVAEGDTPPDTFRTLTRHVPTSVYAFLKKANRTASGLETDKNEDFAYLWHGVDKIVGLKLREYQKEIPFSDFSIAYQLLQYIPNNSVLHVSNSMAIRYVNFIGLTKQVEVYCNRGTSGIDGCLSTAIGAALKTTKTVTLLIGDLAFFYDSNALFQDHLPDNLRIVVLNNHSGNIFKVIDGPAHLPEGEKYFETKHTRSVGFLAKGFGVRYYHAEQHSNLKKMCQEMYNNPHCAILEVITDAAQNVEALKGFKNYLTKSPKSTEAKVG
jgi:2-succinyl-5-enolpyruvyl-6-hydroxy-3-cyclohexene-1-carboxylate synthase